MTFTRLPGGMRITRLPGGLGVSDVRHHLPFRTSRPGIVVAAWPAGASGFDSVRPIPSEEMLRLSPVRAYVGCRTTRMGGTSSVVGVTGWALGTAGAAISRNVVPREQH